MLDLLMVKLKLMGGKNQFYLKVILNIKKCMRTQKKKRFICEHRTFSVLLPLSVLLRHVPKVIIMISRLKRMRFTRSTGSKEGTPGILPESCQKGQVSAWTFPHKAIIRLSKCLNTKTLSELWALKSLLHQRLYNLPFLWPRFATFPYLQLCRKTYKFSNDSLLERFCEQTWWWLTTLGVLGGKFETGLPCHPRKAGREQRKRQPLGIGRWQL